jgi:hypothetical protein
MTTMTLYRPVGITELDLIKQSVWRAFPPRLEWQPIFYPVLNMVYAIQIASDWNTKDAASGYAGFVTAFEVTSSYLEQFEIQTVGKATHQELWIPAEELATFNTHIVGQIHVISAFYGEQYQGSRVI